MNNSPNTNNPQNRRSKLRQSGFKKLDNGSLNLYLQLEIPFNQSNQTLEIECRISNSDEINTLEFSDDDASDSDDPDIEQGEATNFQTFGYSDCVHERTNLFERIMEQSAPDTS